MKSEIAITFSPRAHDRVVPTLERILRVVGAVVGGHEMAADAAARRHRAPRGSAAARMNDIDAAVVDELRQVAGVTMQGERILRAQRQRDVLDTGPLKCHDHRTAGRGNQRLPTMRRDGSGDIHRAAFDASGHQRGQDLKDHAPLRLAAGFGGGPGVRFEIHGRRRSPKVPIIDARRTRAAVPGAAGRRADSLSL